MDRSPTTDTLSDRVRRATARLDGWWPDVLLVVGLLLVTAITTLGLGSGLFLVSLVQVVPLLWRRRAPLPVAGVVALGCLVQVVVTSGPLFTNVAVPVAVHAVAAHAPRRQGRFVLWAALAGAPIAGIRWSSPWSAGVGLILSFAFVTVVCAMVVMLAWNLGDVARRRRAVVARLTEQNRALARDQAQRTALAAQGERAAIAREMHDVVAHSLAVVVVQADGALYAARSALDRPPAIGPDRAALEQAAATLETLAGTARSSLAETRKLVGVLREQGASAEFSPVQGLAYLEELVAGVRASGPDVHLSVRGRTDDLPREIDLAAYRVVQEALTNVLKHVGPGAAVDVDVLRTPTVLLIRVTDDGDGATGPGTDGAGDGEGHGLIGMAERVEVLGGSATAGPRTRGGWEVVATLPVRGQDVSPGHDDEERG